jgi:hypothetical protein
MDLKPDRGGGCVESGSRRSGRRRGVRLRRGAVYDGQSRTYVVMEMLDSGPVNGRPARDSLLAAIDRLRAAVG